MNELINVQIETKDGINVVSSRVVAEQLGKRHDNIKRDLAKILKETHSSNLSNEIILSNYENRGVLREEYLLTKDGFILYMFNIQGYNDFKMAYINRFNEMEKKIQEINSKDKLLLQLFSSNPVEVANAHKQLVELETKPLLNKIKKDKPKVDAYENWINSDATYTPTQMVKLFKSGDITNASKLNNKLHELKFQYKQGKAWFPYVNLDKELYELKVNKYGTQLRWTPKGVESISKILNIEIDEEQL